MFLQCLVMLAMHVSSWHLHDNSVLIKKVVNDLIFFSSYTNLERFVSVVVCYLFWFGWVLFGFCSVFVRLLGLFCLGFFGFCWGFFHGTWEEWLDKIYILRSKEGSWLCKAMSWYAAEHTLCLRSTRSFSVTCSKVPGVLTHRHRLQRSSPASVFFTSIPWATPWRFFTPLYE